MKRNISLIGATKDSESKIHHDEVHQLNDLPIELIKHIISYVPHQGYCDMSLVNMTFNAATDEVIVEEFNDPLLKAAFHNSNFKYIEHILETPRSYNYCFFELILEILTESDDGELLPELFDDIFHRSNMASGSCTVTFDDMIKYVCKFGHVELAEYYFNKGAIFTIDNLSELNEIDQVLALKIFLDHPRNEDFYVRFYTSADLRDKSSHLFNEYVENGTFSEFFEVSPLNYIRDAISAFNIPAFRKLMNVHKTDNDRSYNGNALEYTKVHAEIIIRDISSPELDLAFIEGCISAMFETELVSNSRIFFWTAANTGKWRPVSALLNTKWFKFADISIEGEDGVPKLSHDFVACIVKKRDFQLLKKLTSVEGYNPGDYAMGHISFAQHIRPNFPEYLELYKSLPAYFCYIN